MSVPAGAQDAPKQRPPIIDMHVHAESQDPRFGSTSTFTDPLREQQVVASADEASHMEACLGLMQRLNIVRAVVSSGGAHHEAVLRWAARAPEKVLIGYALNDPVKVDLGLLRKEHAAGRLQILGEIGTQYEGIAPNDPRMEPIYALAEELDLPVALHMHPGPPGAPYPPFGLAKMRAAGGIRCCSRRRWCGIRRCAFTSCMRGGLSSTR